MLEKIGAFLRKLFTTSPGPAGSVALQEACADADASHGELLKQARLQWQQGDWNSLVQLDEHTIRQHPDRQKLALLSAAGHLQVGGHAAAAEKLIRLAKEWGASRTLISQVLIAGVHNNLGRAAALAGKSQDSLRHFEEAISIATPGSNRMVQARIRAGEQIKQLGMALPIEWTSATPDATQEPAPQPPLVGHASPAANAASLDPESVR